MKPYSRPAAETIDLLRASAKGLRMGIESESNASKLEAFADAMLTPTGYTLRINGGVDYGTFWPTAAAAQTAAEQIGLADRDYLVVPLIALDRN